MAFQTVPNTLEAVVQLLINSGEVTMTFYARYPGAYGQAEADALAEQMDLWADTELKPALSSSATYVGVLVRGLELLNDVFAFNNTNTGVGDVVSAPLPNNVAKAVARRSGLTGRSARGRVYFPLYLAALDANENFITAVTAADLVARLEEVSTYMAVAGGTEVIVSRYTAGAPRLFGVTFGVQDYAVTSLRVDSRRDRLPG